MKRETWTSTSARSSISRPREAEQVAGGQFRSLVPRSLHATAHRSLKKMKEFKHPPTRGIKYCSILLWIECIILLTLPPLAFFGSSNSNTFEEKVIYSAIFIALGILGLIAGKKLREAKKWAWVTAISFFFMTLASPVLPFCAVALYILFKKESVMYFTLPHIPSKARSDQDGGINSVPLRSTT